MPATGPVTPDGKEASRSNSLKHGLAGSGLILPRELAEAVARRFEEYSANYPVEKDPEARDLVRQMALGMVRAEICQIRAGALEAVLDARTQATWKKDRETYAEACFNELREGRREARSELEAFAAGCRRLQRAFTLLADGVEHHDNGHFTHDQASLIFFLLALDPVEAPIDPDFNFVRDHLRDINLNVACAAPELSAWLRKKAADCEQEADRLAILEELEMESPVGSQQHPDVLLYHRYAREAMRLYFRCRNELEKRGFAPRPPRTTEKPAPPAGLHPKTQPHAQPQPPAQPVPITPYGSPESFQAWMNVTSDDDIFAAMTRHHPHKPPTPKSPTASIPILPTSKPAPPPNRPPSA